MFVCAVVHSIFFFSINSSYTRQACFSSSNVCAVDLIVFFFFFFKAEDGIRDKLVTGVHTCALPIWVKPKASCPPGPTAAAGSVACQTTPAAPPADCSDQPAGVCTLPIVAPAATGTENWSMADRKSVV